MFSTFIALIKKYDYELVLISSMIFIIIVAMFRLCTYTSWFSSYNPFYIPKIVNPPGKHTSQAPRESSGEIECRRVLEDIYKKPFNKKRPDFLHNHVLQTNNLELDCYNEDLRIAVEYNGAQHYKYIPFMHRTRDSFNNQKYRDHIKRELCQKNGINLIEVPYTVKIQDIEEYLITKLTNLGYL